MVLAITIFKLNTVQKQINSIVELEKKLTWKTINLSTESFISIIKVILICLRIYLEQKKVP